jgi:LysR family transcriptional regulator, cys regulon transcriptional activator
MKLQQLRYLREIWRHQFNISKAAVTLNTSQSGVSKQIAMLEQELNVSLFIRKGKHLDAFSPVGERIFQLAEQTLERVDDIRLVAEEFSQRNQSLIIATTHTQARYVLPVVVRQFMLLYPEVNLHIHQGTPTQIAEILEKGDADIAVATEVLGERDTLLAMPCYQWARSVIMTRSHPLASKQTLSLQDIVAYPIVTYEQGFTGRHRLDEVFAREQLVPEIVLTAVDADVIKTYVRLGLGIGIIADMALNSGQDDDLVAIGAKPLFGISTSQLAVKKNKFLKDYVFGFITLFAPHLTEVVVRQAMACQGNEELLSIFQKFVLPEFPIGENIDKGINLK